MWKLEFLSVPVLALVNARQVRARQSRTTQVIKTLACAETFSTPLCT